MDHQFALRWMKIAARELAVANFLLESYADIAAFHYQQSVEKYLNGFLAAHQVPLRKTHNISTLLIEASKIDNRFLFLSSDMDLDVLSGFATHYRYPNEEEEDFPGAEELSQVKNLSEKVKIFVEEKMAVFERSSQGTLPRQRIVFEM